MKYEAVIFDLDGTILDTIEDLCDSVNFALSKYDLPSISLSQAKSYIGSGVGMLVKRSIGFEHPEFDNILKSFKERYAKILDNKTKPFDGVYDIFKYCKVSGIKMAIVSNKIQSALDKLCDKFFSEYVDIVIGECDNLRRKPYPDSILKACELLKVDSKHILYVGDSEVDIKTVENVGCDGAYVSYGFRSKETLLENGGEKIFDSPYELLNWLRG